MRWREEISARAQGGAIISAGAPDGREHIVVKRNERGLIPRYRRVRWQKGRWGTARNLEVDDSLRDRSPSGS